MGLTSFLTMTIANFNAVTDVTFSNEDSQEPITLEEAKVFCRIDLDGDEIEDDLISSLITTARQQCEGYVNMSFINRTVTAYLNNSCGNIYLPYGPVRQDSGSSDSGSSIQLFNCEDEAITDAVIVGDRFPSIQKPALKFIKAVYDAGYGVLPKKFKTAILQQVGYLYENRGDEVAQNTLSPMSKTILKPHRFV